MQQTPAPIMTQPPVAMAPHQPTAAGVARGKVARRFFARHTVFKVGFALLLFSCLLFFISYVAPAWVKYQGLWMGCSSGGDCVTLHTKVDWYNAVRAMETLAFICLIACVCTEFYMDVLKLPPPPDNKLVEILAVVAMGFHLIGIIIFGAKGNNLAYPVSHVYTDYTWNPYLKRQEPRSYTNIWYKKMPLFWAYWVAIVACVFGLISSFLVAFSRARHAAFTAQALGDSQQQLTPGVMVPMQAMPSAAGYAGYHQPTPHPYYVNGAVTSTPVGQSFLPPPQPSAGFLAGGGAHTPMAPTASQIPVYYIETQGHPIPVYRAVPDSRSPVTVASPPPQPLPAAEPTASQNGNVPNTSDSEPVKL